MSRQNQQARLLRKREFNHFAPILYIFQVILNFFYVTQEEDKIGLYISAVNHPNDRRYLRSTNLLLV